MRKLTISTGTNRKDIRWAQRETTWEKITAKLSTTHRTPETVKEYKDASKERKTELKDVGGFVGGIVEGGHRKKGSVKVRTLLTLDIDYAESETVDHVRELFKNATVIYSTHSHTIENPRLRLVMPLSRDVSTDEYEAIGRKVAEKVGIDMMDDSTYQAERLMFWPSTPKNGEYVFETWGDRPLDVEDILAEYRDWRDISQWPISSRENGVMRREMKKAGDPLEKKGAVGTFCKQYTVQEAIAEYLSDVYVPTTNNDGRYTYAGGSSAGGLVIYDDVFAYSHHDTDPAGRQLCNAFDLVRIHKFGELDAGMVPGTPVVKSPSYTEMCKLVDKDPRVMDAREADFRERITEAFGHVVIEDEDEDVLNMEWTKELGRDRKGIVESSAKNMLMILENAPGLKGNICFDEMARLEVIRRNLPWRTLDTLNEASRFWSNADDAQLIIYMESTFSITGKDKILYAKTKVAQDHAFHPIKEYLDTCEWDGTQRLDTMLIDYLGATDTAITRAVTRKSMVAAIARIYKPGCKFDYCTILQGPEGIGKSTILNRIGGRWFNDSISDIGGKEGMEAIQGAWICELGELAVMKRSDVEGMKTFMSRQTDAFRPAYGRTKEVRPRMCVFYATTNEDQFLKSSTGDRRFWVVLCSGNRTKEPWDIDEITRKQILAEAKTRYAEGETLYLNQEEEMEMRQIQADCNEAVNDGRKGMIEEYLEKLLPVTWNAMDVDARIVYLSDEDRIEKEGVKQRDRVCAVEILNELFHEKLDDRTRFKVQDINKILDGIQGWRKVSKTIRFSQYGPQRGYKRIK